MEQTQIRLVRKQLDELRALMNDLSDESRAGAASLEDELVALLDSHNNSDKIEARQDAQLRVLRRGDPISVVVLGGAHDLSRAIRRGGGDCEYLRVTTKRIQVCKT